MLLIFCSLFASFRGETGELFLPDSSISPLPTSTASRPTSGGLQVMKADSRNFNLLTTGIKPRIKKQFIIYIFRAAEVCRNFWTPRWNSSSPPLIFSSISAPTISLHVRLCCLFLVNEYRLCPLLSFTQSQLFGFNERGQTGKVRRRRGRSAAQKPRGQTSSADNQTYGFFKTTQKQTKDLLSNSKQTKESL